jgi:acyl dehydratase
MTRWFEDIEVGAPYPLGSHVFSAEAIKRFAALYDPQYFHLDEVAARHSHFGGLIASGWHTVVVGHRLMVDALEVEANRLRAAGGEPGVSGPSPGVNTMAFRTPVRPGDTVEYTLTVTSKRPSQSLPGWGLLINRLEGVNQRGEPVYHAEVVAFSKLRDYRMPLGRKLAAALKPLTRIGILKRLRANRR